MPSALIEFPADDAERALRFWRGLLEGELTPRSGEAGEGWVHEGDGVRVGGHERGRGSAASPRAARSRWSGRRPEPADSGAGGAGGGLDAEGRAHGVLGLEEGGGLVLQAPGGGQAAAGRAEEAGEEDGGAVAADAGAGRQVEQVLALGEGERAEQDVGVDREDVAAEGAEFVVGPAFAAAGGARDREAGFAALGEGRLAAALAADAPGSGEGSVEVLEEAGEELRGRRAGQARGRGGRDRGVAGGEVGPGGGAPVIAWWRAGSPAGPMRSS